MLIDGPVVVARGGGAAAYERGNPVRSRVVDRGQVRRERCSPGESAKLSRHLEEHNCLINKWSISRLDSFLNFSIKLMLRGVIYITLGQNQSTEYEQEGEVNTF